jgi:hypothetical protein
MAGHQLMELEAASNLHQTLPRSTTNLPFAGLKPVLPLSWV